MEATEGLGRQDEPGEGIRPLWGGGCNGGGAGRDLADRPADGMWAGVLERAERGDRDLAPLVEALLVADPEDALALRLSAAPVPA